MITIIDYGMGNLYSVEKALVKLGASVVVTSNPDEILKADKVVLPGVGAFGDCMHNLGSYGLVPTIKQVVAEGKPFMGICLGLQLLFDGSEEDPGVAGLGILSGMIKKIVAPGLKVPHMGWNNLSFKTESCLFTALPSNPFVYFVHSYHAVPQDTSIITAVTEYGAEVTAAVGRDNIQAVQFHPEKSSTIGMKILENFTLAK